MNELKWPKTEAEANREVSKLCDGKKPNRGLTRKIRYSCLYLVILCFYLFSLNGSIKFEFAAIASLSMFLFGYIQWRSAQNEASFEKRYDRLDKSNDLLIAFPEHTLPLVFPKCKKFRKKSIESLYVHLQLDKLEYVIEKHMMGCSTGRLTFWGIKEFYARLDNEEFRKVLLKLSMHEYTPETRNLVKKLIEYKNKKKFGREVD